MAQVQVYNQEGKKTSKLELADSVFAIEPNESAMHLAVVSYLETVSSRQRKALFLPWRLHHPRERCCRPLHRHPPHGRGLARLLRRGLRPPGRLRRVPITK